MGEGADEDEVVMIEGGPSDATDEDEMISPCEMTRWMRLTQSWAHLSTPKPVPVCELTYGKDMCSF